MWTPAQCCVGRFSRSWQVLVVEARDLVPVHGIGTNPYVPDTERRRFGSSLFLLPRPVMKRRGRLGAQVRRSRTVWTPSSETLCLGRLGMCRSNLRPAWNCLMEFPVVSTRGRPRAPTFVSRLHIFRSHKLQPREGNLELEVMSRAPLFGLGPSLASI